MVGMAVSGDGLCGSGSAAGLAAGSIKDDVCAASACRSAQVEGLVICVRGVLGLQQLLLDLLLE
jgi:hypothetical protein